MTWDDAFKIAFSIIGSVGGSALIVASFSSWLGKVWANRILEADKLKYASELEALKDKFSRDADGHRTALRKSEFIFQKEFEAASEFVALARSMDPLCQSPDAEWTDALIQIASSLKKHHASLKRFQAMHGAVLSDEAVGHLSICLARATDGSFEDGDSIEPDDDRLQHANDFYTALRATEKAIITTFRSQATLYR